MEAVWLGLAFVVGNLLAGRSAVRIFASSVAVAGIGTVIALPWWARNLAVFGTPLPGQVTDNMFLTRNEQIFAYNDPPTLAGFLAQGPLTILGNIAGAVWHNAVDVIVVGAGPVAVVGLVTIAAALVGRATLPKQGPLAMLLLSGAITFAATSLLFPVATLWGTFGHAAGPLHVGLIVAAVVGLDAFLARVRAWRHWPRTNSWLAPTALALSALPIVMLAVVGAAHAAVTDAAHIQAFVRVLPTDQGTIVTDRPVWLARALSRPALALPDESLGSIEQLVRDFHAVAIIVTEPRGELPDALRSAQAQLCFGEVVGPAVPAGSAIFVPRTACR